MEITNKIVLVTGANRGIGRALVDGLLAHGAARAYAAARDVRRLRELDDDRVTPLTLDITDDRQISAAVEQIERLDVLINNAGVLIPDDVISGDLSTAQHQLDVNYVGPLKLTRAFLPHLEQSTGAVVNVLSMVALAGMPLLGSYSSSKAAAFSSTQALRALLARKGVAVHAVFPGPVDTDLLRAFDVPKASAADVARAVLAAFEAGEEDIFPNPMHHHVHEGWGSSSIKQLEREMAAYADLASERPRGL
jgi:NAD(P)-dependent dehydrogenase (short-subunit alcohol dehydrogenase family)